MSGFGIFCTIQAAVIVMVPGRSKIGGESSGDMPPIILAAPLIREIIRGAARFLAGDLAAARFLADPRDFSPKRALSTFNFQVNFNKNQPRPAAKIG